MVMNCLKMKTGDPSCLLSRPLVGGGGIFRKRGHFLNGSVNGSVLDIGYSLYDDDYLVPRYFQWVSSTVG